MAMESSGGATGSNWTEEAEDLVHGGEVDPAISFLESTISNLENELKEELQHKILGKSSSSIADQLSTALQDLSKLYHAKGFSLKADQTFSRALQIKHVKGGHHIEKESNSNEFADARDSQNEATSDDIGKHGYDQSSLSLHNDGFPPETSAEDDWEAVADRAPEELLSPQCLPGVSNLSLEDSKEDSKAQHTKRRGRGTFAYKKQGLYSDTQSDEPDPDETQDTSAHQVEDIEKRNLYVTRHVLVLADFPPSTRTTDLEKLLEKFKDRFVIRWVNDTTSLAIFRTSSVALEAINSIRCPFTVRLLDEDEELMTKISPKDLEPPRQRPQTSARTAQRLIAQGMGIKLPSSAFGSSELRKQEEARKNRIVSRQNMRDDAWGD